MDLTKPQRSDSFEKLSKQAYAYLNEQQELVQKQFDIGSYKKWYYNQRTGQLTFSDGNEIKVLIRYEEVGSLSIVSNTWLWAWANPHLEEKIKSIIPTIKEYGDDHNLPLLSKPKWYATQYDGWEMTAIAAYILQAKGAYRVPTENVYSFMIFKEVFDLR